MTLRDLKLFCIETLRYPGPDKVPLAGRILADISFYELFQGQELTEKQTGKLKHRLKIVLAKHGTSRTRKLNPDEAKVEISVQQFIQTGTPVAAKPGTFTFNREDDGWFIDLPDYLVFEGGKADLAMVAGADTFLDMIADGKKQVKLLLDIVPFDHADELRLVQLREPESGGGDYIMLYFEGKPINHQMWLCNVTEYVFGYIPDKIYVRRVC